MTKWRFIPIILALLIVLVPSLVAIQPVYASPDSITVYATKDTYMYIHEDYGHGGLTHLNIEDSAGTPLIFRCLLEFPLGSIPADSIIQSATVSWYFYSIPIGNPVGHTYNCDRVIRRDWTEGDAAWTNYKSGSAWTTVGCGSDGNDYTSANRSQATVPSIGNWMNWNVTAQVNYAYLNGYTADFKISENDEGQASRHMAEFYSDEYGSYVPKLVVIYEPPVPPFPLGAVTNLTANQTGVSSANLTWTVGVSSTRTLIVCQVEAEPTTPSEGYVVYNGTGTSVNVTELALGINTYQWSAWALNDTHVSSEYDNTSLGGETMSSMIGIGVFAVLALGLLAMFVWKRHAFLAFGAAGLWALLGFMALQESSSTSLAEITDIWMGLFWLAIMFTVGCALLPAIMRDKPEGDIYVDDIDEYRDSDGSDLSEFLPSKQDKERNNNKRPQNDKKLRLATQYGITGKKTRRQ